MKEPRLLIRLGSMGDVVLATAAANAGRRIWGDACFDVLVKEEWLGLWANHPAVRRLLPWPRSERDAAGLTRWGRRLRAAGYVEAVDLQASLRTRLLTRLAGIQHVRRPSRYNLQRRLLVRTKRWGPPRDFSVLESYVQAAVPGAVATPSLHPGDRERAMAAKIVAGGRFGIIPGARHATKRWPLDRYVAVGRELASRGQGPVAVFFGPDEAALLAEWKALWAEDGSWLPVREELAVVVACLERLERVLTNDTGLMHAAAAVGTPVTAFFGPTVRSFGFFPAGAGHRIFEIPDLSCRPCAVHGGSRCPKGHFRCMLGIDPAEVSRTMSTVPDPEPLSAQVQP